LAIESPLLALTALAGLPVSYAFTRRYLRRAPAVYARERSAMAGLVGGLVETTEGARTLRAYRAGPDQRRRVRAAASTWLGSVGAGIRVRVQFFPGLAVGQGLSLATTLAVGAVLASRGSLSTGQVTACALYVARLHDPLSLLLEVLDELQSAQASLCRLVGVVSIPRPDEPPPIPRLPAPPIGVTARGLGFSYAEGGEVVKAVDLDIAPGERTVIVGASGAGKSTLAGIIAGLLHPSHGDVELGAEALSRMGGADRRRLVALLTQEPHVFAGSVAWNVTLGAPNPDEDPAAALAAVGASWVDGLPQGIDTRVGPGGHRLTPAQAQQLALARLVAADPAVVVLDEATADLTSRAAGAAERALAAALAERTVIAVAHRLDSAVSADQLLVMEDGEIVERGAHADLVQREGRYAALWSAWVSSRV
jgi:ATP-binding cassette subfamily C protein